MDLDLAEYDQVDEVKLLMSVTNCQLDKNKNTNNNATIGHLSPLVVTLSSSIDQTQGDDLQCENDFVFLPAQFEQQQQKRNNTNNDQDDCEQEFRQENLQPLNSNNTKLNQTFQETNQVNNNNNNSLTSIKYVNPFYNLTSANNSAQPNTSTATTIAASKLTTTEATAAAAAAPTAPTVVQQQPTSCNTRWSQPIISECFGSVKPIGLINNIIVPSLEDNVEESKRVSTLMHQIVTRADSIRIEIPCAFCRERIGCLPSDISRWLNHMDLIHNCKCCPICNKLVGLGPKRDLKLIHEHAIFDHLTQDWLEQRATKTNLTFGLRQQWFSGRKCQIIDRYLIQTKNN